MLKVVVQAKPAFSMSVFKLTGRAINIIIKEFSGEAGLDQWGKLKRGGVGIQRHKSVLTKQC